MTRPHTLLLIWIAVVALALLANLGSTPLYDADEGRNGEVGREMAETNDYVMPRIDGMPYLDKPVVYFAAEALAMEVLGPTELAARLPAYLFTLATAAVLFWFARRVWDFEAACVAVIAFLSMPLVLAFSRTVIFDSALSFFVVVAIVAFYEAIGRDTATSASAIAWAAIGFGVITKGPVAILLPLIIAIPFAIKEKRFRALWSWWGLAAFVVIVAPWVYGVTRVVPDFLHYVIVTETAQRLATKALKRTGPPWYFIPYLIGGALPWAIAAIAGIKSRWTERDRATLYAFLWIAIPFLFFSISQSKRPQYILPVMPAVALLIARATKGFRAAAITWIVAGAVLIGAPPFLKMRSELLGPAKTSAIALGIVALVAGIIAILVKRRELVIVALSLPVIVMPIAANPLLTAIGERRSAHLFAEQLRPYVRPSTEIVGVEAYTGSLQFYLRKPIVVVTPDAEEFTSNYIIRHYDAFAGGEWNVRRPPADMQCCPDRIYVVRNDDRANRALLEARGHKLIASAAHFAGYK